MSSGSENDKLSSDERAELIRLREQVEALRSDARARAPKRRPARSAGSAILIALGCLLLVPSAAALWLDSVVTDTDRYVATVAPLAEDPAIQSAMAERISNEVISAVAVEELLQDVVDGLAERDVAPRATMALQGLTGPMANGMESWLRDQVRAFVGSEQFADIWTQLNRRAHDRVVALMTGESDRGVIAMEGNTVSLQLAPLIAEVKQRLVANGAGIAERIPEIDAQFVLVEGEQVTRSQRWFAFVDRLGRWLSLLAVGLIVAGVLVARDRRRALIRAGLGATLAMFALALVLAVARPAYLDSLPPDVDQAAAAAVFDHGVTFLRSTLRAVLVLGLIVAAGAFLAGPSRQATAARDAVRRTGARLGRERWTASPYAVWLRTNKRGVQSVIAIAAALVLVFWDYPGAGVVIAVAVVAATLIAVVELVAADPRPAERSLEP